MDNADVVLDVNYDLPVRSDQPVHNGKVRSVYWLTAKDSERLIKVHSYPVPLNSPLAVMIISDRISAFDCVWRGEGGLRGIPGKGAALNAISNHWFRLFRERGLANSHILDIPHPLVWIVQKAEPLMIEAIGRRYITGSMWRSYARGERHFCGIQLSDYLKKDQLLPELLITPSTKGILKGIPNVPEVDDVNISRDDIVSYYKKFKFRRREDIPQYERLLKEGFSLIEKELKKLDQLFVDTKFEFGYVTNVSGHEELIYMDEVGTPDSSRIWDGPSYRNGNILEKSKEVFRQLLLNYFPEPEILLDKSRMNERLALAKKTVLPKNIMFTVSDTYLRVAQEITGKPLQISQHPRAEIIEILENKYGLIHR